jgi:hypothetical protein
LKAFLEITSAIFGLLGVVAGVYGTWVMTKWTHVYGFWGFLWNILTLLFHKADSQRRKNEIATKLAELEKEKKGESLSGLYFVFLGFVLQTIGAILLAIDAVWLNLFHEVASKAGQ